MLLKQLALSLKKDLSRILNVKEQYVSIRIYENSSSVFFTLEEFLDQYNPEDIGKGQCNLIFRFDADGKIIASFQLKDMYHCCGIIVASDLHIPKGLTNKGIGTILTDFVGQFSKYYGYGIVQATDLVTNEYQTKIFEKLGWKKNIEFVNPKTSNKLVVWFLNLN